MNLESVDEAILRYQAFLIQHPQDPEATYSLALCFVMKKNWPMALGYLEQATLLAPENPLFHNNFANALRVTQQFERAEQHYKLALSLKPEYPEALNNLGVLFYHQDKWKAAQTQFEKALQFNANYSDAHANLGHVFARQGEQELALYHYEKVLASQPSHPQVQHNYGILLVEAKRFEDAKPHLEWSLSFEPNNTETLFHLALIEAGMNQSLEAIQRYESILALNPKHGNAAHNLATLYLSQESYPDALRWYKKALEINPLNHTAQHMIQALTSELNPVNPPPEYISQLFDQYAAHYNQHLEEVLQYEGPALVRKALSPYIEAFSGLESLGVDLGCGTGLLAPYLQDRITRLIGVDLSQEMLKIAEQQGGYHQLIHDDMVHALQSFSSHSVNLITALEALNYVGDLNALFAQIYRCLKPGGIFCFSTEWAKETKAHYVLQTNGRFQHSTSYIQQLCEAKHLIIHEEICCSLRQEKEKPLNHILWLGYKFE